MKKRMWLFPFMLFVLACNQPSTPPATTPSHKILVAYFSHSGENYEVGQIQEGNTQKVAKEIARQTGGTLFRIQSVQKYPTDYDGCKKKSKEELMTNARPALKDQVENMHNYDVIYLGYPIWWGNMPMPVLTFLESYDLTGKTIYPFATHEGSNMGQSETSLREKFPNSVFGPGLAIKGHIAQKESSAVKTAVANWLKKQF